MRERLEELNRPTQPYSLNDGDHAEVVQASIPSPAKV